MSTTPRQTTRTQHKANALKQLAEIMVLATALRMKIESTGPGALEREDWWVIDTETDEAQMGLELATHMSK